jgi:hypothetical protein
MSRLVAGTALAIVLDGTGSDAVTASAPNQAAPASVSLANSRKRK